MKVVELTAFEPDALRLTERPNPDPGPGQVVLGIEWAALNYRDLVVMRAGYGPNIEVPLVVLGDGAGKVLAVGEGVSRVDVGDRAMASFLPLWFGGPPDSKKMRTSLGGPLDGTAAERMVVHETSLSVLPDSVTTKAGATLPCAAVTSYNAMCVLDDVSADSRVLVQGTGGVSLAALQIAKARGAHVTATSSSHDKLERLKALGADEIINYRETPEWGVRARELGGGHGMDHVIEVGGAGTLEQSVKSCAVGATVSLIGVLAGAKHPLSLPHIFLKQLRLQGIVVGSTAMGDALLQLIDEQGIQPVIDEREFDLESVSEALKYLASGKHFGKILVRVS